MDWETLLGLTGLYTLLIVILAHQWIMNKRIINLATSIQQTLDSRREIISKTIKERLESGKEGQL